MWILVMVLLAPPSGFASIQRLATFDTEDECRERQQAVITGMTEAYPDDRSFSIECRPAG
jgi:hypothetical protein